MQRRHQNAAGPTLTIPRMQRRGQITATMLGGSAIRIMVNNTVHEWPFVSSQAPRQSVSTASTAIAGNKMIIQFIAKITSVDVTSVHVTKMATRHWANRSRIAKITTGTVQSHARARSASANKKNFWNRGLPASIR